MGKCWALYLHALKVVMMSDFDSKGSGKHLKEEGEMTVLGNETHPPFFKLRRDWIRGVGEFLPDFESGSFPGRC